MYEFLYEGKKGKNFLLLNIFWPVFFGAKNIIKLKLIEKNSF